MAIRWSVNLETNMVSVQRLLALANLPLESKQAEMDDVRRSQIENETQNFKGKIEFTRVDMRYKMNL